MPNNGSNRISDTPRFIIVGVLFGLTSYLIFTYFQGHPHGDLYSIVLSMIAFGVIVTAYRILR